MGEGEGVVLFGTVASREPAHSGAGSWELGRATSSYDAVRSRAGGGRQRVGGQFVGCSAVEASNNAVRRVRREQWRCDRDVYLDGRFRKSSWSSQRRGLELCLNAPGRRGTMRLSS